ncbi:MAG: hypothetical protein J6J65_03975 [Opitutales bacterium]|nr:hypothetical protein [Opitutales bacterium]
MKSEITDERILWEKRSRYNPLLGLRPQTLRAANDAFKTGYMSKAARIWEEVEECDGIVSTVRAKRRKSVSRLAWNIVPFGNASEDTAKEHASILEDFYNNVSWTHACDGHRTGGFAQSPNSIITLTGDDLAGTELNVQAVADKIYGLEAANE